MNPLLVAGLLSIADEVAAITVYTVLKKKRPAPPQHPQYVRHGDNLTRITKEYLKQQSLS